MATVAPIAMHTDAVLTLSQWLSPAYPIGAFAYSHGLEALVEAGRVTRPEALTDWLNDILERGAGHSDTLFLGAAYKAKSAEIPEIDAACRAFAPSKERLMEANLQGAAFCNTTSQVWDLVLEGLTYPVAVGRAARLLDLPLELTKQMYLQAFLSNLVSVAMRLLPIGQTAGQTLIQALTPLCRDIAAKTAIQDISELSSTTFLSDIAAMKHETQYSRIFRT